MCWSGALSPLTDGVEVEPLNPGAAAEALQGAVPKVIAFIAGKELSAL